MAKYRVIQTFVDLCDKHHIYRPGDLFPRDGSDVSADRIAELASANNKMRLPVIEVVAEKSVQKLPYEKPAIIEEIPETKQDDAVVEQHKKKGRKKKDAV